MAETNQKNQEAAALLRLYDDKIIPAGITAKGKTDEIIDIISGYPWTAQQFDQRNTDSNKTTYSHNIPFCYAIERQQTIGSGAANIVNTILGATSAFAGAGATAVAQTAGWLINRASALNISSSPSTTGQSGTTPAPAPTTNDDQGKKESPSSTSQASNFAQQMKNWTADKMNILEALRGMGKDFSSKVAPRLLESNLAASQFLQPWKWLYLTKTTTKKYVFPTFSSNELFNVGNTWGDAASNKIGGIFDTIIDWIEKGAEFTKGVKEFIDFLPGENQGFSYENYNIEKAAGYNYAGAGSGQEFKSQFILFNTTKKDAWKKNYRFLLMFLLRNIPFRTSIYSFKAPLLYDIIVPGVKHLPLCYVKQMAITANGHVRNMKCDNYLKEIVESAVATETIVPVPEAWRVEITFKCLIPDTANLMLDLANYPINITTVTK